MREQQMASKTRLLRDDDLRQLLSSKGIRVTGQRMTILRELAKLRIQASHPELIERLAGTSLDRATMRPASISNERSSTARTSP